MENKRLKKIGSVIIFALLLFFGGDQLLEEPVNNSPSKEATTELMTIRKDEAYDHLQNVVDYLDMYESLPPNYLTKKEAQALGWEASEGNLWEVAPEMSIGGDYFGNFEGLLPKAADRQYHEADINYQGGYRGPERLVYSTDGLYFYTEDHYESFEEVKVSGEKE